MRTLFTGLFVLTLGWCSVGLSQDLAPNNVVGNLLTATASTGSPPFASTGSYQLFTSADGTNYSIAGHAGGGFGFGSYAYTKSGTNTGVMTFLDAKSGPGISVSLLFTAAGMGTYSLAGVSGSQTGTFTISNYLAAAPAELFLPGFTNNQFQAFLSGRDGFVYSIETSSNFSAWTAWTNATITDLTAALNADASSGPRFYRARVQAAAFAPDSLTNKTFNETVLDGVTPLATNGSCQWIGNTNGNGYQIIGLAGMTNSSGTYSYTKTGPNRGMISYVDSVEGNVTEQLLFTSPRGGCFYETNVSGVESGTFTVKDGPDLFFGNIHFAPDAARSGSVYFPANGTPMSLSVTNASGWVWTLFLPSDALLTARTITMIPSASVDSSGAFMQVSNGVQLLPDGLAFCDGVTLSVTPPAPQGASLGFVMAREDGSDVYFAKNTNAAGTYSTVLYHFSSGGIGDDLSKTLGYFKDMTLAELESLFNSMLHETLEDLDNNRFPEPPPPPDYGANCNGVDDEATDAYVQTIINPKVTERENELSGLGQQLTMLTGDSSFQTEADNLVQQALLIYEQREVNFLFGMTGDPKKFLPLATVVQSVESQMEAQNVPVPPIWDAKVERLILIARDYYGQQVVYHDFSMLNNAVKMGDLYATLSGDPGSADSNRKYLAGVMTFTASMDLSWTFSHGRMEAQGDVQITADQQTFALTGTGSIDNNSGNFDSCGLVQDPFDETIGIKDWDQQCKGSTVDLTFSPFALTPAQLSCSPVPYPASPLRDAAGNAFAGYGGKSAGGMTFNTSVSYGGETLIDQTFSGDSGSGPVTLHVTVTHTPQFGLGL